MTEEKKRKRVVDSRTESYLEMQDLEDRLELLEELKLEEDEMKARILQLNSRLMKSVEEEMTGLMDGSESDEESQATQELDWDAYVRDDAHLMKEAHESLIGMPREVIDLTME